uniref:DUF4251 domain-containing protein n=1 Tax=Chitinophaga sp. TaxID=1869181 RepID=UPI00261009EE
MRILNTIPVWIIAFFALSCSSTQQVPSGTTADIKTIVPSRNFVFRMQSVLPMSGRTRQMAGDGYEVKVSKDTVDSWLPYFGRAYSAPIDPLNSGVTFISTDFEYTEAPRKDGG